MHRMLQAFAFNVRKERSSPWLSG